LTAPLSNQSVWVKDCQRLKAINGKDKPRIYARWFESGAVFIAVGYHCQLLAQGKHLKVKQSPAPKKVNQGCEEGNKYRFHAASATRRQPELSMKSARTEFLLGTGLKVGRYRSDLVTNPTLGNIT